MKTDYPDSLTIQQYLEGKLDPELAHQLEKQALDDPFLWDALEGYSVYRDPAADLSILQRQLHERIVHLQENKKVFDLTWQRLSVAAAAAVMFVSAGILFWMNTQKSPERLASQSHKPVEVNVIDRDSVESVIRTKDEPVTASTKSAASEIREAKVGRIGDESGSLNEVAVSGYNNAPKSGWQSYRQYLDVNTEKFKAEPGFGGSVILTFQVGTDGKLTDIKVIKGLNEAYDKEAIRIVRNGSEWTPAPDGRAYDSRLEVIFKR